MIERRALKWVSVLYKIINTLFYQDNRLLYVTIHSEIVYDKMTDPARGAGGVRVVVFETRAHVATPGARRVISRHCDMRRHGTEQTYSTASQYTTNPDADRWVLLHVHFHDRSLRCLVRLDLRQSLLPLFTEPREFSRRDFAAPSTLLQGAHGNVLALRASPRIRVAVASRQRPRTPRNLRSHLEAKANRTSVPGKWMSFLR